MINCYQQSEDSFVCFLLTAYRTEKHRLKKKVKPGKNYKLRNSHFKFQYYCFRKYVFISQSWETRPRKSFGNDLPTYDFLVQVTGSSEVKGEILSSSERFREGRRMPTRF